MSIDPRYISTISLDEYFVDKDTGLPLANGTLNFFRDNNRSIDKDVFTISGTAPNYTFVNLGSVITLNAVGMPSDDMGNNIPIYYFPYDNEGDIDLYYVEVISADSVPQFTREARPPGSSGGSPSGSSSNIVNFIPNGQFLSHNNIPADVLNNVLAGEVTGPDTIVAPGGWNFDRPDTSTATDFVTFFRFGEWVNNPTASPRYAIQVQCNGADPSDAYKELRLTFDDVNKFASSTQQYTFSFTGVTELSSDFSIYLHLIKNYGTGGDSPTVTALGTFALTDIETLFQQVFIFGDNSGKIIGDFDDDYLQLVIGFPTSASFGCQLTDFILQSGDVTVTEFPQTTDKDFQARTFTAPVIDPNGFDIGLNLICTKDGLGWDDSQIGFVFPYSSPTPPFSYLPCDGSMYPSNGYSPDGIPYRRLRNKLVQLPDTYTNFANVPIFGTGPQYVTANYWQNDDNNLTITTNSFGPQSNTADGSNPTGFTITNLFTAVDDPGYGFSAHQIYDGTQIQILNSGQGVSSQNNAGTTSFTVNDDDSGLGAVIGTDHLQARVIVTVPSVPSAGQYFDIDSNTVAYYVWYKVNGSGSDPSPGGTGILVNLLDGMINTDVAFLTACALSGLQATSIQVSDGSSITPSSYFIFYANNQAYYVWYNLNGAGTDPLVSNAIGIPVTYNSSDTSHIIRDKTIKSINDLYFAIPNFGGQVIKGWSALNPLSGSPDVNGDFRYYRNGIRLNNANPGLEHYIGTSQLDFIQSHHHDLISYNAGFATDISYTADAALLNPSGTRTGFISDYGIGQNDVKNVYMNFCIKY